MPSSDPLVTTNRALQEEHMQASGGGAALLLLVRWAWGDPAWEQARYACRWAVMLRLAPSAALLGPWTCAAMNPSPAGPELLLRRRCGRHSWPRTPWQRWWACWLSRWRATRAWMRGMQPWCSWSSRFSSELCVCALNGEMWLWCGAWMRRMQPVCSWASHFSSEEQSLVAWHGKLFSAGAVPGCCTVFRGYLLP